MVWPRHEVVIHEDTVALVTRTALERQGDQVPEAALRHRVLVREEPVVGVQADVRPVLHRLREKVRAEPARQRRRNRVLEEEPRVSAAPGSRALERGGQAEAPTALKEGDRIGLPALLVEINGQEEARLVEE